MKVKERNKIIIQMVIAIIGVVGGLLGVNAFYQYVLMSLPLVVRMVLMIVTYLPIALVPFCIVIFNKEKWSDYGFSKEKIGYQLLIGLAIALCMSFVFTVIPHLIGKSDWVNNQHIYIYAWPNVSVTRLPSNCAACMRLPPLAVRCRIEPPNISPR